MTNLSVCKTGLNRKSSFGFSCGRCIGCCRFKKIQINPYEIARMAYNLGISTTQFIIEYTTGGTILKARPDDTCIFLEKDGCGIHTDRPLVCRLYPLGRHVYNSGVETFSQFEPESGCRGTFHQSGTIEQYLEEQGAADFMHAADLYLDLLWNLLEFLREQKIEPSQSGTVIETIRSIAEGRSDRGDIPWIDMDRAVTEYCRKSGKQVPLALDKKMEMHINAVRKWAA